MLEPPLVKLTLRLWNLQIDLTWTQK